jgi:hypothetical protein
VELLLKYVPKTHVKTQTPKTKRGMLDLVQLMMKDSSLKGNTVTAKTLNKADATRMVMIPVSMTRLLERSTS